ncbi:MAG: hypothetical protein HeimC2_22430 [Candidatus Heimdallarchaeota archaeon LC_2]|nr:MAG: hypothetical protein HeimC2_22430 [Candidatus Heimdallarchaeota archaeon LC_2]
MAEKELSPSSNLKKFFDEELVEVERDGNMIPFSADVIITDLIESGVSVYDALDVLFETREFMRRGMKTSKLVKLLNQSLKNRGYSESEFIFSALLSEIEIVYPDSSIKLFSYKVLKEITSAFLTSFRYSSKTYRLIVDELYRIIKTIRTSKIKLETIEKMMPAVMRNAIGLNPFSRSRCEDDYHNIIRINKIIETSWNLIPDEEKKGIMMNFLNSIFRIILLSYEYLPGNSGINTANQVNVLVSDLTEEADPILSDKEIYVVGKSARKLENIINEKKDVLPEDEELMQFVSILSHIVHGLMNRDSVLWLIVVDAYGNELYSKFAASQSKRANRSLIAMAISGVQSIMTELTDNTIKQIQNDEGTTILFEMKENFKVITLVNQTGHLVTQRMQELATYIQNNLIDEIINFTGSVNKISKMIDTFVEKKFQSLIK